MSLKSEVNLINQEMSVIKEVFLQTVNLIPSFNITDSKVLPYGLKAHTRSIAWIVEQVITQQSKFHAQKLGLDALDFEMPDTCLHDCVIEKDGIRYFVNVRVYKIDGAKNKRNLNKVAKFHMQYSSNSRYNLIYVYLGVKTSNQIISFNENHIHTFSPQFLPISVNPKSDKIQAFYCHKPVYRTRKTFLKLLEENSISIVL